MRSGKSVTYHLNRGICEINKLGQNFAIFAGGVKFSSIPKRQDSTDKLSKAFGPGSVGVGAALYSCEAKHGLAKGGAIGAVTTVLEHTSVLIFEFEKIALLVEFIGMAVEKRKDGEKLGDDVVGGRWLHEGRLTFVGG